MREFFHGWRRKLGVVILVIACALMGMWMRSRVTFDQVQFSLGARQHEIISDNEQIIWSSWKVSELDAWKASFHLGLSAQLARQIQAMQRYKMMQTLLERPPYEPPSTRSVSYWPVATIFVGLSAYLILWKPRKRVNSDA
jgi:hypothetical protein